MKDKLKITGRFDVECRDEDGNLKWLATATNAATDVGLNNILDVMFGAVAKATWFIGLIRDDNYSALSDGDTMSSHAGWEEADEYSESTRQEITFDAASGQGIVNTSSRVYFTMNDAETIKGMFCVDSSTKSGSTGVLWATALFDGGDEAVVSGDVLKIVYTVSIDNAA